MTFKYYEKTVNVNLMNSKSHKDTEGAKRK